MIKLYRSTGNSMCTYCTPLPFTLSLLFFLLFTITGHAQVVKNAYAKVTGITTVSGKSQLAIANQSTGGHTWAVNDEVIVIQMQDNVISGTGNNSSFGLLSGISNAGAFEVAVITALGAGTITLNKVLTKPFNTGSNASVQVVSFTQLSATNFTTTADITAVPWSGSLGRGGIVAFTVGGTLTLKHAITVDGQGFAGGSASNNNNPGCAATSNYTSTSTNYGAKGEGIYLVNTVTDPSFVRGRARIVSGGGGGNSSGSGGAGGSNFSAGGDGSEDLGCSSGAGLGGLSLGTYLLTGNRAFLGGGGGGGQGNGTQTAGGNGGGIIFIRAGALTTNCSPGSPKISANGIDGNGSGDYGGGGGGAAGTILLQIGSYSVSGGCALTVQANGGDGGDAGSFLQWGGGGGGGGQGAVLISGSAAMNNITKVTLPGSGGTSGFLTPDAPAGSGPNNGGVVGGIGVVLPVHLLFFTAENKNDKAVLTWSIADEQNVTYTIERSTDGSNFTAIGKITGSGQSNYTFTDPNPINGRVYYRLVLSGDLDAKTTYSSIVNVSMSNTSQVAVAYPNPAHDHFYIRIGGDNANKLYKVAVTDLAGQVVYTTTGIPANNIIKVTPGRILKPGLYMFKVTGDGFEQAGKLMIQ
ncbi:MAG: T9SS type A sorting domain-containing protein [Niastella sp.]|uniref:T9SS type A sorting domain-containing protein n=1 Tax=Niastella sp. TaxID=1869183 RepID=UPI00389B1875